MKYWLLEGICTPAHKAHAKEKGVKIIDAKFAARFDKKSIFKPDEKALEEIDAINGVLNIETKPAAKKAKNKAVKK